VDRPTFAVRGIEQAGAEMAEVLVVGEDYLAVVAPLNQVERDIGDEERRKARHRRGLREAMFRSLPKGHLPSKNVSGDDAGG
jgi:hypothetical protein